MFNIPAPSAPGEALLKGFETGSNHMARLLQNKIQQAQMQQAQQQFMQNFGLQQAQENRLSALHPLQAQLLGAQTSAAQQKANKLAQEQQLMQMFLGGGMPGNIGQIGGNVGAVGSEEIENIPMQGQMQGNQPMQQGGQFNNLQDNPMLAGLFKKFTGVDPYMESPSMKSNRSLEDFIKKENAKTQLEAKRDLTIPTQSTITANQEVVNAANSVIPTLEKLMETPSYRKLSLPSAGKAKYQTISGLSTDKLMTALKLPKQKESINLVKQMTTRQFNESDKDFKQRIKILIDEINENRSLANEVQTTSKVGPTFSKEEAEAVKKNYETKIPSKIIRYNSKTGKYE